MTKAKTIVLTNALTLFLAIVSLNLSSQVLPDYSDTLNRQYLEMTFDSLSEISYIDTNSLFEEHCCSFLILGFLETGIQDSTFFNSIFERANQVAQKHFLSGRAIFLANPLTNLVDGGVPQINPNDSFDIVVLSFGPLSLVSLDFLKGIDQVNQTTRNLILANQSEASSN
ncbi:hypothetical protein [Croceimicrobium sp.]|uniref:hypothetical protein n=1 Tax=Croceimicrobium sp. TaxID=2828340 RepID=UPI003BAC8488